MAKKNQGMNHVHVGMLVLVGVLLGVFLTLGAASWGESQTLRAKSGFDEFGYNYNAKLFNGPADGVDRNLDDKVWGDPVYAKDHLTMKWSPAWNDARFGQEAWNCDAWTDNHWNGKVPGGSGEIWHYKIVWVGPELQQSSCWRAGGYPIWGQFEVIFSQGTVANQHFWETHAYPAGYGGF